jgi:DNA (cytosine-5)-methyltransferase 1
MRYLSVCSGIEAATAAWHHMGWQPAAFSEIEPFPSAVLAHHYPNVPNLGDMTKFEDWNVGQIDLLVGGTPCQAFSVAGLRGGLSDARGNLSLVFCKMADHFDPEYVLWENVPGVLSSTDNAFGCFLAGLCGAGEPLTPGRKWSNAGVVSGPKRTVAWRVLDAQFFGVAQRRRRVFVLAVRGSRNWAAARALFPVGEGVFWNSAPSRKTREDVAGGAGSGAAVSSHWDGDYPHPTLNQSAKGSGGVGLSNQEIFSQRGAYLAPQATTHRMVAFGEYLDDGSASAMKARDYKDATDLVVTHSLRGEGFDASEDGTGRGTPLVPVGFNARQDPDAWADRTGPLDTDGGTQAVLQPVTYAVRTANTSANGHGISDELAYTLDQAQGQAVAWSIMPMNSGTDYKARETQVAQPLMAGGPVGGNQGGDYVMQATQAVPPFRYGEHQQDTLHHESGIMSTLPGGSNGNAGHYTNTVQAMQVRRLTPRECERLQGFPDDFTSIPWRKAAAADCPDGPRYKALGNSMAVPVMRWIGERIQGVQQ